MVTEAVRAALEEVAGTAPHLLDGLVDEDWGRRYGRPVRLGKNPTKPKTRMLATGDDAVRLLELGPYSTSSPTAAHPGRQRAPVLGLELQPALASPPRHQHSTMIKECCDKR
ncbi:transposase (plasmid) [Streptomyces sp. HUAS TT11]|uniref:transposase n=1 Tax=Streptomyces sp. HUAS TT11 TaxID=3447508 RepID=UPI003F654F4B